MSEQNAAAAQEVSATTQEQNASVEEMTAASEELAGMAQRMQELVDQFTVSQELLSAGTIDVTSRQRKAA